MSAPARTQISRIGTREYFRWLEGIVKGTLVLNLLDALFTLTGVIARKRISNRSAAMVAAAGTGVQIQSAPEEYFRLVMKLLAEASNI